MGKYLKVFDLTSEYEAYVNGPDLILPNVSNCKDNKNKVYYHPSNGNVTPGGGGSEEPQVDGLQGAKILCKYNVSDTSNPIQLYYQSSGSGSGSGSGEAGPMFSLMEVDGVEQEVTNSYTFDTAGEHTVLFTLSEGVTSIGNGAFGECYNLRNVTIGNLVTSIGDHAFYNCSGLTNITIPDSVTSIGNYAFKDCTRITNITIPDSVTSIGYHAFYNCSGLTNITIPDSVTSIGDSAFAYCTGITSVTIPDSVTSIGESAFNGCSELTNITIPDSVTSIGEAAFYNCSGLTSITIGNSVTSIYSRAFSYCSILASITCNATTAPTIQNDTFWETKRSGTLTVPVGSTGYDTWMSTDDFYLGKYNWTKVEQ